VYDGTPTAGVEPDIVAKGGGVTSASVRIIALVNVLAPLLKSTSTFDSYEAYYQPNPAVAPTFLWADSVGLTGSSGLAIQPATEYVFSFKTSAPGGLKLYVMEGVTGANQRFAAPFTVATPERDLNDFMTGSAAWVTGRNGLYPLVGLFATSKMNDHLRRKYIL
jgi:hypothetical protein